MTHPFKKYFLEHLLCIRRCASTVGTTGSSAATIRAFKEGSPLGENQENAKSSSTRNTGS